MPEPLLDLLLTSGSRIAQVAYAARQVTATRRLRAPQRRGTVP